MWIGYVGKHRACAAEDRRIESAPLPSLRSDRTEERCTQRMIGIRSGSSASLPRPILSMHGSGPKDTETIAFLGFVCFRGRETFHRVPLQASDVDPTASWGEGCNGLFFFLPIGSVFPFVLILSFRNISYHHRIKGRTSHSFSWDPTSRTRRGRKIALGSEPESSTHIGKSMDPFRSLPTRGKGFGCVREGKPWISSWTITFEKKGRTS